MAALRAAGISRTSIYTAAGRAIGARDPDPLVRNPDHLAEKLLGDPAALDVNHSSGRALTMSYDEAMQDVEVVSTVRMMMVRTRFIDDALARAVTDGATHVVILGAGFDSHAYRCQELLANVQVFEVDRPATQAFKKQRVRETLGAPPANLTYVPIDIQREELASVLRRYGHDQSHRTFFIMEGVTMYVPEDAVRATFRYVAGHPAGSAIAFDFMYRPMIEMLRNIDWARVPDSFRPYVERFLDLIKDEPWVFGVPVGGERDFLSELGLELRETLTIGGEESVRRYATIRWDAGRRQGPRGGHGPDGATRSRSRTGVSGGTGAIAGARTGTAAHDGVPACGGGRPLTDLRGSAASPPPAGALLDRPAARGRAASRK